MNQPIDDGVIVKPVFGRAFRADLFYRLNVFPIRVPPLRERAEDIPLLVSHFVRRFAERQGKVIEDVPNEVIAALKHDSWPGNVRELRSEIERAVVLSRKDRIELADLSPEVQGKPLSDTASQILNANDLTVEEAEKQLIIRALKECGGNRTLAAKKIGMSRRTLHRKLHQYHLEGF